ncbi:hypothetical protein AB1Y20_015334 [Prymnesium parvum]|uniref:Uncharacterized protein n=1 Tax=Prymnesium parvum TaxID=97485 RepID=A0AB34K135_PRYPA
MLPSIIELPGLSRRLTVRVEAVVVPHAAAAPRAIFRLVNLVKSLLVLLSSQTTPDAPLAPCAQQQLPTSTFTKAHHLLDGRDGLAPSHTLSLACVLCPHAARGAQPQPPLPLLFTYRFELSLEEHLTVRLPCRDLVGERFACDFMRQQRLQRHEQQGPVRLACSPELAHIPCRAGETCAFRE